MITRKEIAKMYCVTPKTLAKRLLVADIEIKHHARITPKELELIFREFGNPECLKEINKLQLQP